MLLEKFSDILLDKNIKTSFEIMSIEEINDKINTCSFVSYDRLGVSDKIHYNERTIFLEEFKQETTLAMIFKIASDILYGELHLQKEEVDKIVLRFLQESNTETYNKFFDNYIPYEELILVNDINKQFSMMDNSNLSDSYYENLFTNISQFFLEILKSMGYHLDGRLDFIDLDNNIDLIQ